MKSVLIVGAGGVGGVVAHKCAQVPAVFKKIFLASRTLKKCRAIAGQVGKRYGIKIQTCGVDADSVGQTVRLIRRLKPDLLINVALPYQDLSLMEACLKTGTHYLDTANYEPPQEAKFCYKWQWRYHKRFKEKGLMALLGSGFDPGVTNVFCAYAQKNLLSKIESIDILDCNAGNHGMPFATNFNPEINIREITQKGKYYERGKWKVTPPLSHHLPFNYPGIGPRESYLMYHEELESLVKHIKGVKRARFWMTFSKAYLTHLQVLQNVGMTRIDPIEYQGIPIVPLKFLKAILPEPSSLGTNYKGKTCIGCVIKGKKSGRKKIVYLYNICDHAKCYKEVSAQAISYTTGVPAMIGAMLMMQKIWKRNGVFNMEQLDPDPFMEKLNQHGLPWKLKALRSVRSLK